MNIFIISTCFPYPLYDGEALSLYHLIEQLSKLHNLYLLAVVKSDVSEENIRPIRNLCHRIEIHPLRRRFTLGLRVLNLLSPKPFGVSFYGSAQVSHMVQDILKSHSIDVAVAGSLNGSQYLENIENLPKVIYAGDCSSLYYDRWLNYEWSPIRRGYLRLQRYKARRYEMQSFSKFNACTVQSPRDLEALKVTTQSVLLSLATNGVDIDYYKASKEVTKNPHRIVFTGNMDYPPNVDAVSYFSKEIFPYVLAEYPEATFQIVGKNPTREIQALGQHPSIDVTGYVEDIPLYLAGASVHVCPMRFGTGIKNKILQAMAMGLPTISTSLALNGLDISPDKEILVKNDARDFASAVVSILEDKSLSERLIRNARQAVEQRFSWAQFASSVEEACNFAIRDFKKNSPNSESIKS